MPPNATPLDAARAIAARYPSLLDAFDQTAVAEYAPGTARPDSAAIERLEAFVVSTAHVRFADGKRHDGVTLLLDGLTMARRLGDDAAQALVVEAIRRDKDAIPLAECERVRKAADGWLAGKLSVVSMRELALVRLRMRIEAYRWRYGKPPEKLLDAAPEPESIDPDTKRSFRYEHRGGDYRLDEGAPGSLASDGSP